MRPSINTLALLAVLLTITTPSNDYTYSKPASANNIRSTFILPSSSAGNIVSATVELNGAKNSYILQLWPPASSYPNGTPEQSSTMSGTARFVSNPLAKSGVYQLQVLPKSTSSAPFAFCIRIQINNVTVGSYADVARYDRMFVFYHQSMGVYNVEVSTPSALSSSFTLSLFGPNTKADASGGKPVAAIASSSKSITYSSKGGEYFYLIVHLNDSYVKSNKLISVKYQSDLFACPYGPNYSDYNSVYQGCSNDLPTMTYPCIDYRPELQKCLACSEPYVANLFGVCIQSTNCKPNQYFQFGKCYDVISNCANYSYFGGLCYDCKDGYNLTTQTDGTQTCLQVKRTCRDNQYLLGSSCYNLVANCADFQTSTGTCLICKSGYDLQNNTCTIKKTNPSNCPLGYYNQNGACTPIDQNCIFFKNDNTCLLCSKGYLISTKGLCEKIICSPRQYSGSGSCVDVSITCATFDPIYGNCLTCIPLYYLQNDGSCLQGLPSLSSQSYTDNEGRKQSSNCPERYYPDQGTCVQVSASCKGYEYDTGKCTSCVNESYFLMQSSGACVLASSYCTGYRQYFCKGECLQVSNLCGQYDVLTGDCITCRDGSHLINGDCQFSTDCSDREYHGADGSCVQVSKLCGDYNRKNGECLSCISGYELNPGGVCCYSKNYMLDANCIAFFASNCKRQRPKFNNCLECQSGYSLGNNIFGRCNEIGNKTEG